MGPLQDAESSVREAQFFAEFLQQSGFKHPTPESRHSRSSYLKSLNTIHPPLSVIRHVLVSSSNTQNSDQNSSLYFTATTAEHPLRFGAWLTISFNLNYWNRAWRERRFSLILEIQLLNLQDVAMSGPKKMTRTRKTSSVKQQHWS